MQNCMSFINPVIYEFCWGSKSKIQKNRNFITKTTNLQEDL